MGVADAACMSLSPIVSCGMRIADSCRTIPGLFPSLTSSVLKGLNPLAHTHCSSHSDALLGRVPPLRVASSASTATLFPPLHARHPFDVCVQVEVEILSARALSCAKLQLQSGSAVRWAGGVWTLVESGSTGS